LGDGWDFLGVLSCCVVGVRSLTARDEGFATTLSWTRDLPARRNCEGRGVCYDTVVDEGFTCET
jgi:hypothetical protein